MKKFLLIMSFLLAFGITNVGAEDIYGKKDMRIRLSFDNQEVIVKMKNNSATEQFLAMLPDDFEFRDFAGEEKISNFPKPVSLKNVSGGMIAKAGKMFIYAPWGNWGFFYKDHSLRPDNDLIELGEVEKGLENLSRQKGSFVAKIEILE